MIVVGIFAPPRRGRGPAIAGRGPMEHLVNIHDVDKNVGGYAIII